MSVRFGRGPIHGISVCERIGLVEVGPKTLEKGAFLKGGILRNFLYINIYIDFRMAH